MAAPAFADFAREEFETRYARTRALMVEENLDAMLVTERLNYQYYTGHRSEQCAVDKIRSYMFILRKDDEPALITMPFEIAQVEQTSYVSDIRAIGSLNRASGVHRGCLEGSRPRVCPHRL